VHWPTGVGAAVGSKTPCSKLEWCISTAAIGRCFAHYNEFNIQIIGGKLKTMLKWMFLVSRKQLRSMKDGVNKKDNIAPNNNVKKKK
jgi:hypothetical protein